jgi:hypothetical protein
VISPVTSFESRNAEVGGKFEGEFGEGKIVLKKR